MSYHQTTPLDPHSLRAAVVQAANQEAAVLAIFQRLRRALTPSDVWAITAKARKDAGLPLWPLTSIRRALTDLADERRKLVKTTNLRMGPLGRPEHHWSLRSTRRTNQPTRARNDGRVSR